MSTEMTISALTSCDGIEKDENLFDHANFSLSPYLPKNMHTSLDFGIPVPALIFYDENSHTMNASNDSCRF